MWHEKSSAARVLPVSFHDRSRAPTTTELASWIRTHPSQAIQTSISDSVLPPALPSNTNETSRAVESLQLPKRSPLPEPVRPVEADEEPAPTSTSETDSRIAAQQAVEQIVEQHRRSVENLERAIVDLHRLQPAVGAELEQQLVRLAAKIAQRVMQRELATDPTILENLAREGISALASKNNLVVRIGMILSEDETRRFVESLKQDYPKCRVVVDDELPPGGCIVQADVGKVDESLDTRLDNILDGILSSATMTSSPAT